MENSRSLMLTNGSPTNELPIKCGLRHGDLLSLFLYFYCYWFTLGDWRCFRGWSILEAKIGEDVLEVSYFLCTRCDFSKGVDQNIILNRGDMSTILVHPQYIEIYRV